MTSERKGRVIACLQGLTYGTSIGLFLQDDLVARGGDWIGKLLGWILLFVASVVTVSLAYADKKASTPSVTDNSQS